MGCVSWGGEGRFGNYGRACGGAGGPERSGIPTLIENIVRNRLGLGGVEPGALVEAVGEGSLGGLFCLPTGGFPAGVPQVEIGLRRSPGGMGDWGRSGLSDMGQDLCDGLRVCEERDEGEGRLAGRTDQGKHLVDSGQEGGPLGGAGGDGVRSLGLWAGWLGRWGCGGWREGKTWTGELGGEGVILLGPGRNQRPQGRIGGEDGRWCMAPECSFPVT